MYLYLMPLVALDDILAGGCLRVKRVNVIGAIDADGGQFECSRETDVWSEKYRVY